MSSFFKSPFHRKKEEEPSNGGHLDPSQAAPKTPGFLKALFGTETKKPRTEAVSEEMFMPAAGTAYDSPPLAQYGSPLNLQHPLVDLLSGDVPPPASSTKVARIQPQDLQSPWKSQRLNEASSTGRAVYAKSQTWAPSSQATTTTAGHAAQTTSVATVPATNHANGSALSLGAESNTYRSFRPSLYGRLAQSRKRGSTGRQGQIERLRKGMQAAESLDFFAGHKPTTHFSRGRILNQSSRLTVFAGKRRAEVEDEQPSSKRQRRVQFSETDDGSSTTSRTSLSTGSTMNSPRRVLPVYVPPVPKTADGPFVFGQDEYDLDHAEELHGLSTRPGSMPPFVPKPAPELGAILAGIRDTAPAKSLPATKSVKDDSTEKQAPKKSRPTANEDGEDWDCKECQARNDTMASKCKTCNTPRTSKEELANASWGGFGMRKQGEWQCKACYVWNPAKTEECLSCETPKPGSDKKAASAPAASATKPGAIGTSGFSFPGAGAATSTKSPSGAPAGFSFGASVASPAPSGFSFGAPSASDSKPEKPSGGFSFVAPESSESKPASGFSFGSTLSSSKEPAGGESQSKSQLSDASSTQSSGFQFSAGATSKDNGDGSKPSFSFGAAPAPTGAGFSFGGASSAETTTPTTTTTTPGGFSMPSNGDKQASSQPAATTKPFSFGSSKPSDNGVGSSAQESASGPVSNFSSSQTPPPSEQPKVSFDNRPATEPPNKRRVHETSADMGTPASTTVSSGFSFGAGAASQEGGERKKKRQSHENDGLSTNSTSGFSFGGATPSLPVPSLPAPTPAPADAPESLKAPAFSFGAGSTATETAPPQTSAPAPGFVFAAGSKSEALPVVPAFGQSTPAPSFGMAAPPSTAGFGAPPLPPPSTSFGAGPQFGSPAPAPGVPSFGAPAPTPGAPSFGAPAPTPGAPSFGAPAATPGGAPSFGAPAPAAPTFGASAPSPAVPAFGAPAPAGFGNAGGMGAAPDPFGNPGGFGNTAPAPPPMQFGSGNAMAAPPAGGFGFNAPAPPAAAPAPFFGNVPPPVPPPSGGFGAPAAPAGFGGAGFGGPPALGGAVAPQGFQPQGFGQAAPPSGESFSMGAAPRAVGRRRVIRAKRPSRQA